jgi:hypothetical protein
MIRGLKLSTIANEPPRRSDRWKSSCGVREDAEHPEEHVLGAETRGLRSSTPLLEHVLVRRHGTLRDDPSVPDV